MSKIRDSLANDVKSMGFVQAFQEGWESALQNAPEVTALVEALEDILKIDTDQTKIFPCGMIAKDALTQWNKSTTKKREE